MGKKCEHCLWRQEHKLQTANLFKVSIDKQTKVPGRRTGFSFSFDFDLDLQPAACVACHTERHKDRRTDMRRVFSGMSKQAHKTTNRHHNNNNNYSRSNSSNYNNNNGKHICKWQRQPQLNDSLTTSRVTE